jgi:hypothetical protein
MTIYGLLEGYSLSQYAGCFSEVFYNLKRASQPFTSKQLIVHWTVLVAAPTIKSSFLSSQHDTASSFSAKMRLGTRSLYEFVSFCFKFGYLLNMCQYYSPIHQLLGLKLQRMNPERPLPSTLWHQRLFKWLGLSLPLGLLLRRLYQWWINEGISRYRDAIRKGRGRPETIKPPPLFEVTTAWPFHRPACLLSL